MVHFRTTKKPFGPIFKVSLSCKKKKTYSDKLKERLSGSIVPPQAARIPFFQKIFPQLMFVKMPTQKPVL